MHSANCRSEKRASLPCRPFARATERHARNSQTNDWTSVTDGSRRAASEQPRVDAVLLYLEVKRFVVSAKKPRRFALVTPSELQNAADGLFFGLRRGRVRDLLQRAIARRRFARHSARRRIDANDGQVRRLDDVGGEQNGATNDVTQLAHVTGPVITQKDLRGRFGDLATRSAELDAGFR